MHRIDQSRATGFEVLLNHIHTIPKLPGAYRKQCSDFLKVDPFSKLFQAILLPFLKSDVAVNVLHIFYLLIECIHLLSCYMQHTVFWYVWCFMCSLCCLPRLQTF